MNIEYANTRLAAASTRLKEATRLFGHPTGRKYMQRIALFRAMDKFSDLYGHQSLRLHPLKGDRLGEYSVTLTGNFRLIIEKLAEDTLRILGVEDYHGD